MGECVGRGDLAGWLLRVRLSQGPWGLEDNPTFCFISSLQQRTVQGPGLEGHELQQLRRPGRSPVPGAVHERCALSLFHLRHAGVCQPRASVSGTGEVR